MHFGKGFYFSPPLPTAYLSCLPIKISFKTANFPHIEVFCYLVRANGSRVLSSVISQHRGRVHFLHIRAPIHDTMWISIPNLPCLSKQAFLFLYIKNKKCVPKIHKSPVYTFPRNSVVYHRYFPLFRTVMSVWHCKLR